MNRSHVALPLGALLAFSAAHAQTTWIVDVANGPGTSFTDLPPAIAVAADGDIVRVRPGTYAWANFSKGLRILGSGSGAVIVQGPGRFEIGPTGPTQTIWLEGLHLRTVVSSSSTSSALRIQDAAGPVVMRDIQLESSGFVFIAPYVWESPLVLRRCAHVHLTDYVAFGAAGTFVTSERAGLPGIDAEDCFLEMVRYQVQGRGGVASSSPQPGGAGLRLRRGHAVLVDSTLVGGPGDVQCLPGGTAGPGGAGIEAREGAQVIVYGRTQPPRGAVTGGGEFFRLCFGGARLGPSGPGISLDASSARFEGIAPEGGAGVSFPPGAPAELRNGATIVVNSTTQPPIASIAGTPIVGNQVTLRLEAAPSATAFLVLALEHRYLPLAPAAIGSLLLAPATAAILGPSTLAGTTWDLPIDLVAGWPVDLPVLAQFLVIEPNGVYASNAAALVLLSP